MPIAWEDQQAWRLALPSPLSIGWLGKHVLCNEMLAPLVLTLLQTEQSKAHQFVPRPPAAPFVSRQEIAEPDRLAITPRVDGVRAAEEWDPLVRTPELECYFQWEPERLHVAARLPQGRDLIVSLDLRGDGWLSGRDNIEVRIRRESSGARIKARVLDGRDGSKTSWLDMPGLATASLVAASEDPASKTWFVEATLQDPGIDILPSRPKSIRARVDSLARGASIKGDDIIDRRLSELRLGFHRAEGLPEGVRWKPEGAGSSFTTRQDARIRLTFSSKQDAGLRRIDLRTEGYASDKTNRYSYSFPEFDGRGRAFVDYVTRLNGVPLGYHAMRATISSEDGAAAEGQVSFRVAPPMEFDLVRERIKRAGEPQLVRMTVFLRSNTPNRLDGTLRVTAPRGFEVKGVSGKTFVIYGKRSVRRVFDLQIPAGAQGTFPVALRAILGERALDQTEYVTIK